MIIRHAHPDDLQAIVDIYNAAILTRLSTADIEPVTAESRHPWFQAHDPTSHPVWVAEESGRVVGWLSLQPFHPRAGYRATAEVSVYVAPAEQRRGIGRMLLAQAMATGPFLGLKRLVALVFGHNPASLRLFEHSGFQRWGLLPGVAELEGVERDLVILGRRLG